MAEKITELTTRARAVLAKAPCECMGYSMSCATCIERFGARRRLASRMLPTLLDALDAGLELEHALRAADELALHNTDVRQLALDAVHVARTKHEDALDAALGALEEAIGP